MAFLHAFANKNAFANMKWRLLSIPYLRRLKKDFHMAKVSFTCCDFFAKLFPCEALTFLSPTQGKPSKLSLFIFGNLTNQIKLVRLHHRILALWSALRKKKTKPDKEDTLIVIYRTSCLLNPVLP
jgi:hypothetical protein